MEGYAEQIELLQARTKAGATTSSTEATPYNPDWAAIDPLLATQWNQSAPYNDLCPTVNGYRCPTGCVATAIAQIMYHHRWPQEATAAIPAYTTDVQKIEMPALEPTVFEWDKMPLNQTEQDVDNAVARLNLYVGQACNMNYEPNASGASSFEAAVALFKYFGYDQNLRYYNRASCNISEWHSAVYQELAAGRPVYYSGAAPDVGHAFVCDGYDEDGYYHINWGWGGHCDGYFLLEVLNPNGTGIGGSTTGRGFSDGQFIIVGCQPPTGKPAEPLYMSSDYMILNGMKASTSFRNYNIHDAQFEFGWAVENADGTYTRLLQYTSELLSPLWGYEQIEYTISPTIHFSLPGTYRVVPVSHPVNSTAPWKPTVPSKQYIEVTVAADKTMTAVAHPVSSLTATDFNPVGNMIAGAEQNVDVTIKNTGEEFYGTLLLFASRTDEKGAYRYAEVASVMENGKSVVRFSFTPEDAGEWNIWSAIDELGNDVSGQSKITILEAPTTEAQLSYVSAAAEPYSNAVVQLTVKNESSDPYLRPMLMYLYKQSGSEWVYAANASDYKEIPAGQQATYTFSVSGLEVGTTYLINWFYYKFFNDTNPTYYNGVYLTIEETPTGIKGVVVEDDTNGNAPYYSIDGVKHNKPNNTGIYIRNGKKILVK